MVGRFGSAFFDLGIISETTHERRLDDNTTIWIEGFYRCLYDDQGRIVGHLGIQRDMTNLKSMQSRLVQQEAYLRFMIEVQEKTGGGRSSIYFGFFISSRKLA